MSTAEVSRSHPLAHLPFVKMLNGKVILWSVSGVDDWSEGCTLGRVYAETFLADDECDAAVVYSVLRAVAGSSIQSVEVGFLTAVAEYAEAGWVSRQASPV